MLPFENSYPGGHPILLVPTDSYFWPISLLPLNYRHNFSRLIMPPMYRSYELQPKPIDGLEPPTYRLQGDCTVIVLYRLSRGKAVPFSFLSVTVLYATVFWIASENTFAETPQLKLCKQARSDSNAYLTVLETAVFPIKLPTYQYPPFTSLV